MTDPQLIFCESINLDSVLNACSKNKSKLPVVVFKMEKHKSIPNGVIDFANLIKTKGNFFRVYYYKCLFVTQFLQRTLAN